jgi:tetratricopeptide (TPR) repeat protein
MALVHYYRGAALERVGRLSEALDAYRRTTAIDPQHSGAWFEQAQLLEQRGEWAEAAESYERVATIDPLRSDAAIAAGVICHYRLADPERALEHYRVVLRTTPTHYGAHYQRAVALLASGKEAEAIQAWRAFVPLAEAVGDSASLNAAPEVLRRAGTNGNERKPTT